GRQFQQGVGYLHSGSNHSAGLSVFNLRGATGPRNEGMGVAGRATWAPILGSEEVLHLGGWYSHENLNEGSGDLKASANYAGRRGPGLTIATTPGSSANQVDAWGLELAGLYGPAFVQAEYASASFGQPLGADQDVEAWYVQGSVMLNGGRKVYKAGNGVFGSPKVGEAGLWELTARFDHIENRDLANVEAESWILGLNYYLNPNLRLMFNYTRGENALTGDEPAQYAVRTQFSSCPLSSVEGCCLTGAGCFRPASNFVGRIRGADMQAFAVLGFLRCGRDPRCRWSAGPSAATFRDRRPRLSRLRHPPSQQAARKRATASADEPPASRDSDPRPRTDPRNSASKNQSTSVLGLNAQRSRMTQLGQSGLRALQT